MVKLLILIRNTLLSALKQLSSMKRLVFLICSAVMLQSAIVHAQFSEATITFDNLNHNFGAIEEAQGIVEYTFNFTNTGSKALVIKTVRSTCGCTVPEWSREPIRSMGKGTIKVTFNPAGRPGAFRKEITILSNAKEPKTVLYIVGLVNPKTKTVYDEYPIQMNEVRFRSNHLSVTRIKKGELKTDTLEIYNGGKESVEITVPEHPDFMRFEFIPTKLKPKMKGQIIVHYEAEKKDDWGFVMDKVYLHFNGVKFERNLLAISATIEENFDNISAAEMQQAPNMIFTDEAFNFGTIKRGEKVTHVFNFKNTGKQKLYIRKMTSTCGCTASEPSADEFEPGAAGNIKVTFNSAGKIGKQFQTITMITNDPHKSTKLLRVIGTVVNESGK